LRLPGRTESPSDPEFVCLAHILTRYNSRSSSTEGNQSFDLRSRSMTIRNALLVLAVLAFGSTPALPAQTVTAFKTGEQTTGMTKQCFYDALGNQYTRTYGSVELCPLSIRVRLSSTSSTARAPQPYP